MAPSRILFSQHSSNPLEAHPSDPRNVLYNTAYHDANSKARSEDYASSSDPHAAYPDSLQAYHEHLTAVIPGHPLGGPREGSKRFADLDAEQEDDMDDLNLREKRFQDAPEYDEDMDGEWEVDPNHDTLDATNGDDTDEEDMAKNYFELDEDEELNSLDKKTEDEIAEINTEIAEFYESLPLLSGTYRLIDRLGTGTFSSVYKALDLQYHKYDNVPWLGFHPPSSSAHFQSATIKEGKMVFVAIKRIYVTSGPERIKNELDIMEICRGARHVSQIITAFRCEDQVAIVMPYQRNEDFREYYECLPIEGIKAYFRCLLRALRDIHTRGIIHRDVKPANFLFDPATGQGTLCDFGLAQTFERSTVPSHGACLHTLPSPHSPHGQIQGRAHYDEGAVKAAQMEARTKSKTPSHLVGVPMKDTRMPMKANRAGTRGFRAPEVLLKCGMQSGAVDVWSAGVILLFFLTHKFPLFQSNDDVEALMELAMIFGRKKMEGVATLHARKFSTNVPDLPQNQMSWNKFVEKLNPDIMSPPPPNERFYPYTLPAYREKLAQQYEKEQAGNNADEDDEDMAGGQPADRDEEVDDEQRTPTKISLKRKDKEWDGDVSEQEVQPNGRRRTNSYSSSPLRFPESSPAVSKPLASASKPGCTVPSPRTRPPPSTSSSRPGISNGLPPCPQLQTQESFEAAIRDAMDLVSKLLEPESVKRITPEAALAHPFLFEEVPDHTAEGGMRVIDDDDFVPHLFGEGVCGDWHFHDDVRDQDGVIIRRRMSRTGDGKGQAGKLASKETEIDLDEQVTKAEEEEEEDDEVIPPSDSGEGVEWDWEEVRLLVSPGEGIAIGREPCEFHKDYMLY